MSIKKHIFFAALVSIIIIAALFFRTQESRVQRLEHAIVKYGKVAEAPVTQTPTPSSSAANSQKTKPAENSVTSKEAIKVAAEEQPVVHTEIPDPAASSVTSADLGYDPNDWFLAENNLVSNGDFKEQLAPWHYWQLKEGDGKKFIALKEKALSVNGQANRLMGVAQSVTLTSGTVYRLGAKVKSQKYDSNKKEYLGARLALNAPNQKEQQVVWLYNRAGWVADYVYFTNYYSGPATIFFHTGYTKDNTAPCEVTEIVLEPLTRFSPKNRRSSNPNFEKDTKGWRFWHVSGEEASNAISRVSKDGQTYVRVAGAGKKLLGLSQAVSVKSGAVYRLKGKARPETYDSKKNFGGRIALYAPGHKEQQLVWLRSAPDWTSKEVVFTNSYTGLATLFFHMGYVDNEDAGLFTDITLTEAGSPEKK